MERDAFMGGDQTYLREVQYADSGNLAARASLHVKYRTGAEAWFPWLVSQIDWPPSGEVLEVGCGPGWMWAETAAALPAALRLTLTDLSSGMTETAALRVGGLGHFAAVRSEVADAGHLPFPDDAFDAVVANHMLYHLPRPADACAELARVLRPGGRLLAAANGPANLREVWQLRAAVFDGQPLEGTTKKFGSVTGLPLLQANFGAVEWRAYPDALRCTDPDDVIAYLTSSPPGETASPEQRTALRHAVHDAFAAAGGVLTIAKDTGAFVATDPQGH